VHIDSSTQRGFALCAFAILAAILGSAACSEYTGTKEGPGVYPSEADIDRPKMALKDAGQADAGSDAAADAGADGDAKADADTDAASDGATSGD